MRCRARRRGDHGGPHGDSWLWVIGFAQAQRPLVQSGGKLEPRRRRCRRGARARAARSRPGCDVDRLVRGDEEEPLEPRRVVERVRVRQRRRVRRDRGRLGRRVLARGIVQRDDAGAVDRRDHAVALAAGVVAQLDHVAGVDERVLLELLDVDRRPGGTRAAAPCPSTRVPSSSCPWRRRARRVAGRCVREPDDEHDRERARSRAERSPARAPAPRTLARAPRRRRAPRSARPPVRRDGARARAALSSRSAAMRSASSRGSARVDALATRGGDLVERGALDEPVGKGRHGWTSMAWSLVRSFASRLRTPDTDMPTSAATSSSVIRSCRCRTAITRGVVGLVAEQRVERGARGVARGRIASLRDLDEQIRSRRPRAAAGAFAAG